MEKRGANRSRSIDETIAISASPNGVKAPPGTGSDIAYDSRSITKRAGPLARLAHVP
jgi:hypothetical protein